MGVVFRLRKRGTGSKVVGATLGLSLLILTFDFLLAALQCKRSDCFEAFPVLQNGIDEEWIFWAQLAMPPTNEARPQHTSELMFENGINRVQDRGKQCMVGLICQQEAWGRRRREELQKLRARIRG